MPELDADIAATLTQEELDAINAEASPEEMLIMRQAADGEEDNDGGEEEGGGGQTGGEGSATAAIDAGNQAESGQSGDSTATADGAAQAPSAEGGATAGEADQAADEVGDVGAKDSGYVATLPADYQARVDQLATARDAAWNRFDTGELDRAGLQQELAKIDSDQKQLDDARIKAEISQEMSQQSSEAQWRATVGRAMVDFAKPENGGIDYLKDEAKQSDLDEFVKILGRKAENADKPMAWFLSEAHKRVMALHDIKPVVKPTAGAQVQEPAKAKDAVKEAVEKRKPPVDAAPKTLAQVPGGDGPGDVGGEFADLDALDGMELEDAIARMSPAQRAKYLAGM